MADKSKQLSLETMRHSLAHIMAAAILKLWPKAKFGVGPVIDTGFYYDVDLGNKTLTPRDLSKIEDVMHQIIAGNLLFERVEMAIDQAIEWAKNNGQGFKVELLADLKKYGTTSVQGINNRELGLSNNDEKITTVTLYKIGDFEDLCRGPHIASTSQAGAFKLHKISGAYWRGNENNPQLQRVYGVAFTTQKEVDNYFKLLKEAVERDHRLIGKQLDLFIFSESVGSGLPLYTPKGTIVRNLLKEAMFTISKKYGGQEVAIPHIAKVDLYNKSGHAQKFADELFIVKGHYQNDYALKPVNCPHHIQIYASRPRSYRELPLHYVEFTTQYRDEKPGEVGGLTRTRGFTVDDGHIFCTIDQVGQLIKDISNIVKEFYTSLNMYGEHWVSLSLRDLETPDKYIGEEKDWQKAEVTLKQISAKLKLDAVEKEGEAALYGPKLDFMFKDAVGRDVQLATIQLDFATPKRFGLTYIDQGGTENTPVMIHRAIAGSFERFLAILLEKFAGNFPFWLAPEQVRVVTVNDQVNEYVERITSVLSDVIIQKPVKYNELRFSTDERNQSLGKKIREAELAKIPLVLVVGPKDAKNNSVSVRSDGQENIIVLTELKEYLEGIS